MIHLQNETFSHIVCLSDLFQTTRWKSEGFFDLVREPIRQGCGIDIGSSPNGNRPCGLLPGFDIERFRDLAGGGAELAPKAVRVATWHHMPREAVDYLFAHLADGALILSQEMAPWLRDACAGKGQYFVDFRHAPLKFGRDLYVALATSSTKILDGLGSYRVCDEELGLEAALLSANVRAHRDRMRAEGRYSSDLEGSLVILGQHPDDWALISNDGHVLNLLDFSERLSELARGRQVLYMTDYEDPGKWVQDDRQALSQALGVQIRPCRQNVYQVLGWDDNVVVAGISASALQEAAWFDKVAHAFAEPYVPLPGNAGPAHSGYIQVHFQDFIAPAFWHQVLTPHARPPRLPRLPALDRHYGRETLDAWWDYEKVLTWGREIPSRSFERSGGGALKERIDALEISVSRAGRSAAPLARPEEGSMYAAIERLKDTKRGQTAYILGNAPSLRDLDIATLMTLDSFWCNRAYEMENDGIPFRPKYYFCADLTGFQRYAKEIMAVQAGTKFFREEVYRGASQEFPDELSRQNIISFKVRQVPGICMCDDEDNFSYDPASLCFSGWTSVLDAAQFAYYMGYQKVYVGGVELDYSGTPYFYGREGVSPDDSREFWDELTDRMRRSFMVARKHFEKNGRTLEKITKSPNLPLNFVELPEVLK